MTCVERNKIIRMENERQEQSKQARKQAQKLAGNLSETKQIIFPSKNNNNNIPILI